MQEAKKVQDEDFEILLDATQRVRMEPSYKEAFEVGRKLNRAYNEELPGLTVKRIIIKLLKMYMGV